MDAKRLLVFNVTADEVDALWAAQGGKCAVCKHAFTLDSRAVCIEHCHKTGMVRGLVCFLCNRALGLFQDNPEKLKAALAYLAAPPAYRVFGQRYACIGRAKSRVVPRNRRGTFYSYGSIKGINVLQYAPTVYRCGCCDFSDKALKVCCLHKQPKIVEQGTATEQAGDTNSCPVGKPHE